MSVWFVIPSKRPATEADVILKLWKQQGYNISVWRDDPLLDRPLYADLCYSEPEYPGYAVACNAMIASIARLDPDAEWFVTGGDDIEPDLNHTADQIAAECKKHFTGLHYGQHAIHQAAGPGQLSTFGVMQPTGDRFAGGSIDRICGSPWLGREFCRRMYGGAGPYYHGYMHQFVDEELQHVAIKLGVLWQRPDLIHLHLHCSREARGLYARSVMKPTPDFLKQWNSPLHWNAAKKMFLDRKKANFPEHEPIP